MNTQALERITNPNHPKGATEESIFARNRKAKTTAALVASVKRKAMTDDQRVQGYLDMIAGRHP